MRVRIKKFLRRRKVHLVSWGFFLFYEILLVGTLNGKFASFWDYLVHYVVVIALFYLHATVVLPMALGKRKRRYWLLPLVLCGEIAAFISATYAMEVLITEFFHVELMRALVLDYYYFLRSTWRAIYIMGFGTGYYFLSTVLLERQRAERAERQHLLKLLETQNLRNELIKSQNAFLKAQINPHFLFNTLSFVYNSVRKTSEQAADAIMSLSQMMRYALQNEDELQETDLPEEIEHVEHLIRIHQIRHAHQLQLSFSYSNNLAGIRFVPLVLITLVENTFKHGDLTKENHRAKVYVDYTGNLLSIRTSNLKNPESSEGHRIGLDNIQKRLLNVYKERASFKAYSTAEGYFRTEIEVISPTSSAAAVPAVDPCLTPQEGSQIHVTGLSHTGPDINQNRQIY